MEGLFSSTEELVSGFIKYLTLGIDIKSSRNNWHNYYHRFISALKILRETNESAGTLAAETVRLSLARSLPLYYFVVPVIFSNYSSPFFIRAIAQLLLQLDCFELVFKRIDQTY
jgi:hypothetical protein